MKVKQKEAVVKPVAGFNRKYSENGKVISSGSYRFMQEPDLVFRARYEIQSCPLYLLLPV